MMNSKDPEGTDGRSRLDAAIDDAVRQAMTVDAPAGLRARVLSRIETRSGRWFPVRESLAAGAIALAMLLVFVLMRAPQTDSTTAPGTTAAGQADAPVVTDLPAPPPPAPRVEIVARSARRTPASADRSVAAAQIDWPGTIAPLNGIRPITVDPVRPASIATPEIVIAPLAPIAELHIEPLSASGGRE